MLKIEEGGASLTTLDGIGSGLQGNGPAAGLSDVDPEHHPHTCVLAADVRLALAQLDVRVAQLEDARAVDPAAATQSQITTADRMKK